MMKYKDLKNNYSHKWKIVAKELVRPSIKKACCDIIHWKNPIVTGAFLALVNIGFLVYSCLDMTLLTLGTYKLLAWTTFAIIRRKYTGQDCKECSWFDKENVEKLYIWIYDNANLLLDQLREIVLLQNTKNLIKLFVTIVFFISVGNLFSTLTLSLLIMDYYILFNFVSKTEQYTTIRKQISEISHKQYDAIKSKIPKYNEPQKRD